MRAARFQQFQEMLAQLSAQDQRLAEDFAFIVNGPPHWDIVKETNNNAASPAGVEFTFANGAHETPRGVQQKEHVVVDMSGMRRGVDEHGMYLVVSFFAPTLSRFIYHYDLRRRTGRLVDVNFNLWSVILADSGSL